MISILESLSALSALGARLRAARIERSEPMEVFAERIGVSRPTLHDMERGAPTVQIGHWINALWALDRLNEVSGLLVEHGSLFDQAKAASKPRRQRAVRKRQPIP
jgi:transcriptional regulator with XRE-family HTH domain